MGFFHKPKYPKENDNSSPLIIPYDYEHISIIVQEYKRQQFLVPFLRGFFSSKEDLDIFIINYLDYCNKEWFEINEEDIGKIIKKIVEGIIFPDIYTQVVNQENYEIIDRKTQELIKFHWRKVKWLFTIKK